MESLTKVNFTNLEKILYPKIHVNKSQIIEYYIRAAPNMLGFLEGRAIVINRFPDGVEKEGFYEKDMPMGTPKWVKTFMRYSKSAKRYVNYVLCDDLDTLLWLANLASLDINITLSRAESYDSPDLAFFDIDPEPPVDFNSVIETALVLKEKLDKLGLASFIKTSGKKGMHVIVPLASGHSYEQARDFVHSVGRIMASESKRIVSELSQSKEPGKIFVDYMQNAAGRTMICPYSLRATENATVSTPLEWREVRKGLMPEEFNIFTVVKRKRDPWKGLFRHKQRLELKAIG